MTSKQKTIKVMLEIPSKWIDIDDPMFGLGYAVRDQFQRKLEEAVNDLLSQGFELPPMPKISPKEVKNRMLDLLANKALEKEDL